MRQTVFKTVLLFGSGFFPAACSGPDIGPAPVIEAAHCPEDLPGNDVTCGTVSVPQSSTPGDDRDTALRVR